MRTALHHQLRAEDDGLVGYVINLGQGADDTVLTLHRILWKLVPADAGPLTAPESPLWGLTYLTR